MMIHRSGVIALRLVPISAAVAFTRPTVSRSSVSGIVKNCGAWGSIAPPITVEFTTCPPDGVTVRPHSSSLILVCAATGIATPGRVVLPLQEIKPPLEETL